jgi:DNA sulfur modification protein DndC
VFDKIGSILKQDWGSLEAIEQKQAQLQKRNERDLYQEEVDSIENALFELQRQLVQADDIAALFSEAVQE